MDSVGRTIIDAFPTGIVLFLLILAAGLKGSEIAGFRYNLGLSAPVGIFKLTAAPRYERGMLVAACPPATMPFLDAGHCPAGSVPLLKQVAARPGDRVSVTRAGVRVNGGPLLPHSAPYTHSRSGHRLPQHLGDFQLKGYWLYGPDSEFSYDSRYFGEVNERAIVSAITPVWLFR